MKALPSIRVEHLAMNGSACSFNRTLSLSRAIMIVTLILVGVREAEKDGSNNFNFAINITPSSLYR